MRDLEIKNPARTEAEASQAGNLQNTQWGTPGEDSATERQPFSAEGLESGIGEQAQGPLLSKAAERAIDAGRQEINRQLQANSDATLPPGAQTLAKKPINPHASPGAHTTIPTHRGPTEETMWSPAQPHAQRPEGYDYGAGASDNVIPKKREK